MRAIAIWLIFAMTTAAELYIALTLQNEAISIYEIDIPRDPD